MGKICLHEKYTPLEKLRLERGSNPFYKETTNCGIENQAETCEDCQQNISDLYLIRKQ